MVQNVVQGFTPSFTPSEHPVTAGLDARGGLTNYYQS